MRHLDLFSGIGGFALAAQWAGFETVCFCEIDPYCQKVLAKHWPGVPIIGDIRDVTAEKVMAYTLGRDGWSSRGDAANEGRATGEGGGEGVSQDSERGAGVAAADHQPAGRDGRAEGITLVTGGFPCQPFSVAGKRGGKADDRFLWPEMLRVIAELKPAWVLGENVAGIINMELDNCLADLEAQGYATQAFVIPACAVNAPHRRDRVWIVGHAEQQQREQPGRHGRRQGVDGEVLDQGKWGEVPDTVEGSGEDVNLGYWATEPAVGRVAHGIPRRVDRLKALGNAIVPQVAYQIMRGMK